MSDIPAEYRERLDLRAVIEEIDRRRAESMKLTRESDKFIAEQRKLIAEAGKLDRDRWLAPWLVITSVASGVIGLVGGIITVLGVLARWKGWGG